MKIYFHFGRVNQLEALLILSKQFSRETPVPSRYAGATGQGERERERERERRICLANLICHIIYLTPWVIRQT